VPSLEQDARKPGIDDQRRLDYLQAILARMPQGFALFDENHRLRIWNERFAEPLGLSENFLKEGLHQTELLAGLIKPPQKLSDAIERSEACSFVFTANNGHPLKLTGEPVAADGLPNSYLLTHLPIDDPRARHAYEREHLAQKVFRHTPAGILFTDEDHRILSVNPAALDMTGFTEAELTGRPVFNLLRGEPEVDFSDFSDEIAHEGAWKGELEVVRQDGEHLSVGARVNRVDDPHDGSAEHFVWILADITERKKAEERMRHMAQHDALTGLPNRLSLLVRLAQLLPEARRHEWKVAIMFIDLDRFKIINDTLGHQVGDEMLREVACRLSTVTRGTDFVARLGGDEFVIILPGITTPADAAIVASKVIGTLSTPIRTGEHELHTTPSIGISVFPDDGPDGDTILKNADTAMYHAKAAGRNNYQFFANEMNQAAAERLNIEHKLRHAISRNELSLAFQPQFKAKCSTPTGVEALVRWHHPTDGPISPARFIPVAEETGMIVEIGDWVLVNACREMQRWINAGLPPLRIAVNVSARQLRRRDFCETVAGALAESALDPELLELEITESAVMENPHEAIDILERLGRMGVTLAIDDFGTGYSSLAYLKLFPIDHLKIDRSFVADIETDLNDRAIALGTIALAHSLGLNVIAEGVETEDQLELLRTNGCDEIQGFLLGKPMNGATAFAFLHARFTDRTSGNSSSELTATLPNG
jgi:diguanylate cyclase (GGDEF)-like protein/PAS domain S-box-containing protein